MNAKNAKVLYGRMKERDFSTVIDTAIREFGVENKEQAKDLLDAFLQWIALIPEADRPLQMFRGMDRMWHAMLINTAFYREFCEEFIGGFVDHDPKDLSKSPEEKRANADYTVALLKQAYGSKVNQSLFALEDLVDCCDAYHGCPGSRAKTGGETVAAS